QRARGTAPAIRLCSSGSFRSISSADGRSPTCSSRSTRCPSARPASTSSARSPPCSTNPSTAPSNAAEHSMDTFLQDLRFGLRQLRRTPGFTTAALVALALGIGATTAIFTVLDRVVLRPLPYPEPDRLAMVWDTSAPKALTHERISPVTFHDYRNLKQVFVDGAGWWYPQVNVTESGKDPLRVSAVEASGNFFSVIGVPPILGEGFPAAAFYLPDLIAVISHRLLGHRFEPR